jgi:transposase
MKKTIRETEAEWKQRPDRTVGVDLGDRFSRYCVLNGDGEVMEEGQVRTSETGFRRHWEGEPRQRIVLETGTHSPWISRLLQGFGHQVIVANARKLRAISQNESKNDRQDAEMLARLGYCDPKLLAPIRHRSAERQRDLNLLRARDTLVRARTMLINATRGLVKSAGGRLPAAASDYFVARVAAAVPAGLEAATQPLLHQIAALTAEIRRLDQAIEKLGERYPEIVRLRTVPGVGPVIAAAYVLTLNGVDAVQRSRSVGAFLGLRPRQSQSGNSDPEHNISKTGNQYLRRLLVQAAHYTLGRFGPDSALRRWGLKLAAGGKRAQQRAVVAVARKLAVLLHHLWRTGQDYRSFPEGAAPAVGLQSSVV